MHFSTFYEFLKDFFSILNQPKRGMQRIMKRPEATHHAQFWESFLEIRRQDASPGLVFAKKTRRLSLEKSWDLKHWLLKNFSSVGKHQSVQSRQKNCLHFFTLLWSNKASCLLIAESWRDELEVLHDGGLWTLRQGCHVLKSTYFMHHVTWRSNDLLCLNHVIQLGKNALSVGYKSLSHTSQDA